MAEVQKTQNSGEMTQRFIAFVMMQAQQASLFLGEIPHPQTGKSEVNLEAAKFFIDQLEMIQDKTRGNLTEDETRILAGILADLQMAYVRVAAAPVGEASSPAGAPSEAPRENPAPAVDPPDEDGDSPRKRFSKSYGS